jgi:ribonucleases P/MRP protein subunit RPP40
VVKGKFSGWREVLSGVPQGSVLGPLLFSIFINDLDSAATAEQIIKKFADDTKVGQILEGPHSHTELQATLDRLCKWAVDWGMQFNMEKCHVMHVGRGNPNHEYSMNGTRLATTKEERDVGFIISENLKPAAQCKKAAQTASSVLGQIHRSFHYRDRHTYVWIYKQYVRPHLEFASPAWSPWLQGYIDCLEKVQERAVKAISGLTARDYAGRLKEIGLPTLAARRKEADMLQTYKIISDSDKEMCEQLFEMMANRRPTRQNAGVSNLVAQRATHGYRQGFYSVRVSEPWNSLPDNVKEAKNASVFKKRYRQHTEQIVVRGDEPARH